MKPELTRQLEAVLDKCEELIQSIQGGEFGKPDADDLALCGKLHRAMDAINDLLDQEE